MDGTLIDYPNADSSWGELYHMIGFDNKEFVQRWIDDDDYTYVEFTEDGIDNAIENGLTMEHMEELKSRTIIKEGFEELVEFSNNNNMEIVIITGGIGNIAEYLCQTYGLSNYYASCYINFDSSGKVSDYIVNSHGGPEEKVRTAEKFAESNGHSLENTIFIGDDINDTSLLKRCGYTFNVGNKDLESNYSVDSLNEIPKILNKD